MPKQNQTKNIIQFLFEAGHLRNVKRSGWTMIGIKDGENVAEHSLRCAIVGYVLAKMENADSDKVVKMCVFHDLPEARITDLHKVADRYLDRKKAEKHAFAEQMERLPEKYSKELSELAKESSDDLSKESTIARDADLIECALSAKEYIDLGHKEAIDWIHRIRKFIRTNSAKKLLKEIEKTNSKTWWVGLKKLER